MDENGPRRVLPPLVMLVAVAAWLWPIGFGGKMPVGGDVTQFSMGLMAVLGRALRAGRLPLWNDLWGFGFPGLAESQMGVYYPPHALLYRGLTTEAAYTASLVLHTLWAALGAFWAARRFGVSPRGAALSGFCWAASGLFQVHLPHQWGYTSGSWMPWAIGLAWPLIRGDGRPSGVLLLAGLLTLQVLPGHFQFAFETQVALLGMAAWCLLERPAGAKNAVRSSLGILVALALVGPLAAMQLYPTLQLARSASSQRTFEYLSAFPASPAHLVNYVAPNLFHLSPLWRPLAWDPFHAMPEEHRPYIGLVPLMLALGTIRREVRRDKSTRLLTMLAVGSLLLSLGPYVPGFSLLIRLPGFSFFRAPARWGLVTELALAILAGKGFDAWRSWPGVGGLPIRFAAISASAILLILAVVELAFVCTEGPGLPSVASGFEKAIRTLPWKGDPPFARVMASTRRGPTDSLILGALIREGMEPRRAATLRLDRERRGIYLRELTETGGLLVALVVLAPVLARRRRWAEWGLLALTFVDLILLGRHRAVGVAPLRPLIEQSVVLGRLADLPAGSRTIDGLRNFPMVAGAAPVLAYRTLDRPAMLPLIALAGVATAGPADLPRVVAAMRAVGASVRVFDPLDPPMEGTDVVTDPALASWIFGEWSRRNPEATRFRLWKPVSEPARAWFVGGNPASLGNTKDVLEIMARARPVRFRATSPEQFEIEMTTTSAGVGIVSVLDDPEWRVEVIASDGPREVVSAPVFSTKGGGSWQAVRVSGPGNWRFRWTYRGRAAFAGLIVSAAAWLLWAAGLAFVLWRGRGKRRDKQETTSGDCR